MLISLDGCGRYQTTFVLLYEKGIRNSSTGSSLDCFAQDPESLAYVCGSLAKDNSHS